MFQKEGERDPTPPEVFFILFTPVPQHHVPNGWGGKDDGVVEEGQHRDHAQDQQPEPHHNKDFLKAHKSKFGTQSTQLRIVTIVDIYIFLCYSRVIRPKELAPLQRFSRST